MALIALNKVNFNFGMVGSVKFWQNLLNPAEGLTFEMQSRAELTEPRKLTEILVAGVTCVQTEVGSWRGSLGRGLRIDAGLTVIWVGSRQVLGLESVGVWLQVFGLGRKSWVEAFL